MANGNGGSAVVLVVDDNGPVRRTILSSLHLRGIRTYEAGAGEQAITIFKQFHGQIRMVFLDVQMEGMDGPKTLEALKRIDPGVRCCFITGNAGDYSKEDLLLRGALRVVQKPFGFESISDLISTPE